MPAFVSQKFLAKACGWVDRVKFFFISSKLITMQNCFAVCHTMWTYVHFFWVGGGHWGPVPFDRGRIWPSRNTLLPMCITVPNLSLYTGRFKKLSP